MILTLPKNTYLLSFLTIFFILTCCSNKKKAVHSTNKQQKILTGASQTEKYLSLLKGKRVAIVGNQTSIIDDKNGKHVHLTDSLLNLDINVVKVFSPEHGFRGTADAGEVVKSGIDTKTGLPIISLYGKNKKPTEEQLKNVDIIIFDIQDVGIRFYTYISTLHYIMESCAELNIPVIVLDRPNPNAHYIDGPVLDMKYKSFVGMHPVPIVYGMTIGEYAQMINGEKWLKDGIKAKITVIPLKNYHHKKRYELPIKPSPNLPNSTSINLYPSLCFFEGTNVSAGRGTDFQFQIYGSPYLQKTDFLFTPKPNAGAKHPKHKGKICYGENLTQHPYLKELKLKWLITAYKQTTTSKNKFWNAFFTKLAGNKELQQQIEQGISEEKIRASWQQNLEEFKKIRKKYLLY